MFSIIIKRVHGVCGKTLVRNIRNKKLVQGSNPGVGRRLRAFRKEGIEEDEILEDVEGLESDFQNAHEVYDQHIKESLMGKHNLRHRVIEEKYFKENMPNLLTWSEKEQIRHLAKTQPDEWTPEKIAESFPVTAPVVKKLLKYTWKPTTAERIARHDKNAMRNWKQLEEGTFHIPKQLCEHFLKFSNRTIPPLNMNSIQTDMDIIPNEKLGEYESIVKRCGSKENVSEETKEQKTLTSKEFTVAKQWESPSKNYKAERNDYNKRVTFDELTTNIKDKLEKGTEVGAPDQIILNTVTYSSENKSDIINNSEEYYSSYENNKLIESKNNERSEISTMENENDKTASSVMDYPERIHIPKKAHKWNATYKVNDCYYDHDGKFLYRVLGMTNTSQERN